MLTDPIADMLTCLRNANTAMHEKVDIPSSRLKVEIARILKKEGFVKGYKVIDQDIQDSAGLPGPVSRGSESTPGPARFPES